MWSRPSCFLYLDMCWTHSVVWSSALFCYLAKLNAAFICSSYTNCVHVCCKMVRLLRQQLSMFTFRFFHFSDPAEVLYIRGKLDMDELYKEYHVTDPHLQETVARRSWATFLQGRNTPSMAAVVCFLFWNSCYKCLCRESFLCGLTNRAGVLLINKGLPQQVVLHVWFDRFLIFFVFHCLSWHNPKGISVSSQDELGIFRLLNHQICKPATLRRSAQLKKCEIQVERNFGYSCKKLYTYALQGKALLESACSPKKSTKWKRTSKVRWTLRL